MEKIKNQLSQLSLELERVQLSKERVLEIKEITLSIASNIDKNYDTVFLVGAVSECYKKETRYVRRQVKRAIKLLLDFVSITS